VLRSFPWIGIASPIDSRAGQRCFADFIQVFPEHNMIPSAFGTDGPLHSIYAEGKKEEENRSYAASERVDPEELVFDGICTVH